MSPGKYHIQPGGVATIHEDGRIELNLVFTPMSKEFSVRPLQQIWQSKSMSYEYFESEMKRHGKLTDDGHLLLSGPKTVSLIEILEQQKMIRILERTELHKILSKTFKLNFTDARSLQGRRGGRLVDSIYTEFSFLRNEHDERKNERGSIED